MLRVISPLECMHYDFWHYRYYIDGSMSSKEMRRYLNAIHNYRVRHLKITPEIKANLKDVKKCVRAMNVCDCTREKLDEAIEKLLSSLTQAIRMENPAWEIPKYYKQ